MSNELAIAAVTAVLKNLLDNGTLDDAVVSATGAIKVTARGSCNSLEIVEYPLDLRPHVSLLHLHRGRMQGYLA